MLKKLQSLYPTAIASNIPPSIDRENYYWFKENGNEPLWLGIPKPVISNDQLELLSTLYELIHLDDSDNLQGTVKEWYSFLFHGDTLPPKIDKKIRIIQFHIHTHDQDMKDLELAIKEFFHKCLAFIWLDETSGIIIEEMTQIAYKEEDFHSIAITLENDFYIRTLFYVGKFRKALELRESFFLERDLFIEGLRFSKEQVLSFENIFPTLLASNLPTLTASLLHNDVIKLLKDDPELRETMEVFLEHHSNTSLAAKKLYIHRNTLQYRLNRFSDKTNIDLKNINSILTVYIACILAKNMT